MKLIQRIKENKSLVTILIIGTILRFYRVDFQSVWLDEIHTLNEASPNLSLAELYNSLLIAEPHPPLYFILVHYLFIVFGYTTFVLRFFSATLGVMGILAIYFLGKEMISKKVGLIAAILLTVNPFHLNYSQDGRMYALLFLTTTISFMFLIKFIKKPVLKSAILYGLFSAFMIYSHFFALFALFAQYLILLYFLVFPTLITRIQFFKYCLIAAIITIVLYLPTYSLILKTSEMTSIWIQMPTSDAFTQIFKDFFGQSEMVLFLITPVLLLMFLKLFTQDESSSLTINPKDSKLIFSSFILLVWIFTTLFLPLVRTYISLPMIINRYFINILPAILILIAIGISYITNKSLQVFVLSLFFIFSINDIVIVKRYYTSVNKSQFREVSEYIIQNNTQKDPVVSSLGWYFPFFLNNEKVKNIIIEKSLDDYINEMAQDSTKRKSFWYTDGHNRPYKVIESTQKYLDDNFEIDYNIDLYDNWTKHYVLKGTKSTIVTDVNKKELLKTYGNTIKCGIDSFKIDAGKIYVNGWASFEKQSSSNSKINLVLKSDKEEIIMLKFNSTFRNDVTVAFKNEYNLDNSGFESITDCSDLPSGKYQLGILIIDKSTKKEGYVLTEKYINK
jgi:hypothetical protein